MVLLLRNSLARRDGALTNKEGNNPAYNIYHLLNHIVLSFIYFIIYCVLEFTL